MKKLLRIISAIVAASILPVGAALAEGEASEYDDELVTFIVQTDYTPAAVVEAQARSAGQTKSNAYTKALIDKTGQELEDINTEIRDRLAGELGVEADGIIYTQADSGFTITCRRGDMDRILDTEGVIAVYEDGYFTAVPDDEQTDGEASAPAATTSEFLGQGTLIAIIDSGFEIDHPYFSASVSEPKLSQEAVAELTNKTSGTIKHGAYYSEKVPFIYSYPKKSDTKKNLSLDPEHGTHVAGIAAGKNGQVTYRGETVTINGAAPEAQLALMACSSMVDGSISYSYVKAAIDDACALDADVINMSLGSDYIDVRTGNQSVKDSIANAREKGIVVCTSQGNASRGFYDQQPLVTDIDYSAAGFPNGDVNTLSVASADTPEYFDRMTALVAADGSEIAGKPVIAENGVAAFADTVKTATGYVDCGQGYAEDFNGKDLTGKVALIQRGDISFTEKTTNAKNAGAIAAVVYDNIDEAYPSVMGFVIPGIFISKADGERLAAMENKTIYANGSGYFSLTNYVSPNAPSSFSSWGFSATMALTPNITAYGGNVFSSLPGGGYGALRGTSMSSPYMAGVSACVKSYLNTDPLGDLSNVDISRLIQQLLMSTAVPIKYAHDDTLPYSPRVQGAGMVNADNAMNTKVVLYNTKNYKTLIELGDNSSNALDHGFTLNFTARNFSDEDITFDRVDIDVTTDWMEENDDGEYLVNGSKAITPTYTAEPVTVPAFGSVSVSIPVEIDTSIPDQLAGYFKNGIYLDGFIRLSNDDSYVGIPFSGFRGNWCAVPVWDNTIYHEGGSKLIYQSGSTNIDGTYLITNEGTTENGSAKTSVLGGDRDNSTRYAIISPKNGDGYYDNIAAIFAAKRTLAGVKLSLLQKNSEKQARSVNSVLNKYTKYGYDLASSASQKKKLADLPDGDYTFRLTGTVNDGKNKQTQNLNFPLTITIDNTAPTMGMELSDDHRTLTVNAADENYLRSITVRYTDMSGDERTETKTLDCTEKEYTHEFTLDDANPWTISVTAEDYAYNSSTNEEYAMTARDGENKATAFKRTLSGSADATYTGVSGTVTSEGVTKSFAADFDTALTPSGGNVLIGVIVEGLYDNKATAEFNLR